jgi:hypothetical protein
VATRAAALTGFTVAGLTVPFYWHDPAGFGPLEAADRLLRLDVALPRAGTTTALVMTALAVWLATTPMSRAALFRNCALVQAVPVAAGLVVTTLAYGHPDLLFAAYGTFFSWFVFMSHAVSRWTPSTERGRRRRANDSSRS